jgi:thiamine biosynthesis lipoprotein
MGTLVTIEVVGHGSGDSDHDEYSLAVDRAFAWFSEVEKRCSRFDPDSELRALAGRRGGSYVTSDLLFAAIEFSLELARDTNGAFDPTVGARMELGGFDRDYRTGLASGAGMHDVRGTWKDVVLDPLRRTIEFTRPVLLDLGAVAKGMAIDLAARELRTFVNFAIDAGGDLYFGGHNQRDQPWVAGIRHPVLPAELIEAVRISDAAVCTSGLYERAAHILDARTGSPAKGISSVTVIAPTAMAADALATAAFVLGPHAGLRLLERHGVEGAIWTDTLERHSTKGYASLLSNA